MIGHLILGCDIQFCPQVCQRIKLVLALLKELVETMFVYNIKFVNCFLV